MHTTFFFSTHDLKKNYSLPTHLLSLFSLPPLSLSLSHSCGAAGGDGGEWGVGGVGLGIMEGVQRKI